LDLLNPREADRDKRNLRSYSSISMHIIPSNPLLITVAMLLLKLFPTVGMKWAGHVARMGEGRDVHRVLVGRP
jgi:hypothetical protein